MIPIIDQIEKLLQNDKMNGCKYLCLVGGLSSSSYFKYKMRKELGDKSKYNLKIVIPERPILSVVEGAAYFGITRNYIQNRL